MTSEVLLDLVTRELLPALDGLGYNVAEAEQSNSFDNASVTLNSSNLRLRLVRERGQIFADFGPPTEPNVWFDSAVIVEYLGLSSEGGFHSRDSHHVMKGIASFVRSFQKELGAKFAGHRLTTTKQDLNAIREKRAERLFGG